MSVQYPGDDNIASHQDYKPSDGWNCAEVFRGKDWRSVPPKDLLKCAIPFLLPQAFHYYLPTYMLAKLEHPDEADVAGDFIVYSLVPPSDQIAAASWLKRMNRLDNAQKTAVRLFLETVAADQDGIQRDAREALDKYWNRF